MMRAKSKRAQLQPESRFRPSSRVKSGCSIIIQGYVFHGMILAVLPVRNREEEDRIMDKVIMFELPVDNLKRASAFYKKAFGWQIVPWNGSFGVVTVPEDKNWVPKEKGAINGEMYRRQSKDEKPILVILVPSVTRAIDRLKQAGGKVVSEKEAYGEWGWYARVKDPEGNVFGLWEHMK